MNLKVKRLAQSQPGSQNSNLKVRPTLKSLHLTVMLSWLQGHGTDWESVAMTSGTFE